MDGLLAQYVPKPRGLLSVDGMAVPGNIDLDKRIKLKNKDGTFSTIESMSVNMDGIEWLIPTIREDGVRLNEQQAIDHFKKTGRHLGGFAAPDYASAYAKSLSQRQGDVYGVRK